ncbi:MAG TPA: hypothetical protein VNF47_06100 [Streptosporangiaceae bacterium]|nr:hypothetical protein [Streptosporangiaceae bacterium]
MAALTRGGPAAAVERVLLPGAGQYEVTDPLSTAWPQVMAAFGELRT